MIRLLPATLTMLIAFLSVIGRSDVRAPILVELYTSQGCSSCPSADALLRDLVRTQPIPTAEIIPLGFHVDYWNRLGWTDPYSSGTFSNRQRAYGSRLKLKTAYTPQVVIGGTYECVGSNRTATLSAISRVAEQKPQRLSLRADHTDRQVKVTLLETPQSLVQSPHSHAAWAAALVVDDVANTVARGENAGRTLQHIAVVRDMCPLQEISANGVVAVGLLTIPPEDGSRSLRVVAWRQDINSGAVSAVGAIPLRQ